MWLQGGNDGSSQSRKVVPRAQSTGVMPPSFFTKAASFMSSISKTVDQGWNTTNDDSLDIRKQIEDVVARLKVASNEEEEARKAAEQAKVESDQIEAHKCMLQAQVEAAVVAATGESKGQVPSAVLSLELESLVGRTRQVEQTLRVAQAKTKEAYTAHYW
jgi:uncharacterized protein YhaN